MLQSKRIPISIIFALLNSHVKWVIEDYGGCTHGNKCLKHLIALHNHINIILAVRPRLASWESGYAGGVASNSITHSVHQAIPDMIWDTPGILGLAGLDGTPHHCMLRFQLVEAVGRGCLEIPFKQAAGLRSPEDCLLALLEGTNSSIEGDMQSYPGPTKLHTEHNH